jgi:hypothetical protein
MAALIASAVIKMLSLIKNKQGIRFSQFIHNKISGTVMVCLCEQQVNNYLLHHPGGLCLLYVKPIYLPLAKNVKRAFKEFRNKRF